MPDLRDINTRNEYTELALDSIARAHEIAGDGYDPKSIARAANALTEGLIYAALATRPYNN